MKTARLFLILLNFALIAVLAFAGMRFYTHVFEKSEEDNYFKEHKLPSVDLSRLTEKKPDTTRGKKYEDYRGVLEELAKPPEVKTLEPDPVDEPVPTLPIKVECVVYFKDNPASSGAHILAGRVPRYVAVGDTQLISKDMPYRLKAINEDKPEQEYTLVFEDDKGNEKHARYVKR